MAIDMFMNTSIDAENTAERNTPNPTEIAAIAFTVRFNPKLFK